MPIQNPGAELRGEGGGCVPASPLPPMFPAPCPRRCSQPGWLGEPGPAWRVPSNDTHYTGVWQHRGGEGPRGPRSHGTQPAHPRPFLILYESGAQGRQAGWGGGAGMGPAGAR